MKKIFTVLLVLFAGLILGVNLNAEEEKGINLVTDGGFESFYIDETEDIVLPGLFSEDFNLFRMGTFTDHGNSRAVITKEDDNAYAKLQYDGISAGDNSNIWIYTFDLNQGAGEYVVSFDLYIEGFSTGDFFGFILLGVNGALNVQKDVAYNLDAYEALDDSTAIAGWKNVSYTITQTEEQAANNDTLSFNLFNKKDEFIIAHLDNISVKKDEVELLTVNSTYVGDFECYYQKEQLLDETKRNGFSAYEADSAGKIVKDGDNKVLKLAYAGDDKDTAGFLAAIGKSNKPGTYQIELDLKYPEDLDTNRIGYKLVGDKSNANSAERTIATGLSSLNRLEDSETLPGYKHFTGTVSIEKFAADNVDNIYIYFNTKGIESNYLLIDNLSVKLIDEWPIKDVPAVTGLVFHDLVKGGDFEHMEEGYSFVGEPQEDVHFWGSIDLDSPGIISVVDGSKVLEIGFDGTRNFASAFVFLDSLDFDKTSVYELSFRYKPDFETDLGKAFHVSFVGPTGQENFKVYLNYTDSEDTYTNGINPYIYPYTLTEEENGWISFQMQFQLNDTFLSTVDSLRFLINTVGNNGNKVYFDDVKFGYYGEEVEPTEPGDPVEPTEPGDPVDPTEPTDPTEPGDDDKGLSTGAIVGIVVGGVAVVAGAVGAVIIIKKRRG